MAMKPTKKKKTNILEMGKTRDDDGSSSNNNNKQQHYHPQPSNDAKLEESNDKKDFVYNCSV